MSLDNCRSFFGTTPLIFWSNIIHHLNNVIHSLKQRYLRWFSILICGIHQSKSTWIIWHSSYAVFILCGVRDIHHMRHFSNAAFVACFICQKLHLSNAAFTKHGILRVWWSSCTMIVIHGDHHPRWSSCAAFVMHSIRHAQNSSCQLFFMCSFIHSRFSWNGQWEERWKWVQRVIKRHHTRIRKRTLLTLSQNKKRLPSSNQS